LVLAARDAQKLVRARQDLMQRGVEALAVPCEVTNQEQICSLVDQAIQHFGRVDIVVNNAGIIQVGPMSTTTVEDFATALDVMSWGALGFDHGVGHSLLLLSDAKASHAQKSKKFNGLGHYPSNISIRLLQTTTKRIIHTTI